jgi:hypothetical protein
MAHLTPFDANVITRLAGLGGIEATPVRELAIEVGETEVRIRRAKERAVSKIRRFLIATRHPALCKRN